MPILVSVIMPCFNVGDTLERALDSVLMQKTDFDYEIIIVDDASSDNTLEVAKQYQQKYGDERIVIFRHLENTGNSRSFYDGLSLAKGDYFCVLDGDDYYTINDKLQRQVDFFRKDIDEEYVATAHYYVVDTCDGRVYVSPISSSTTLNYTANINGRYGYFHTATYMYRNVFRGNVLDYYKEIIYRGDTPRTVFHLMYTNKKVRILNFVGSAYCYTNTGIWSSLKVSEQFQYQIRYLTHHRQVVRSQYEKKFIDGLIATNKKNYAEGNLNLKHFTTFTYDDCLRRAKYYASIYTHHQAEFMKKSQYYSEYLDSLISTISYMHRVYHTDLIPNELNNNHVAIVVGVPEEAYETDIWSEALELMSIHSDKQVAFFVTDTTKLPEGIEEKFEQHGNAELFVVPEEETEKLHWLYQRYMAFAPEKAYYFLSGTSVYASALMQNKLTQNIAVFTVDYGFILGMTNPCIDKVIVQRAVHHKVLAKKLKDKLVYIPKWLHTPVAPSYSAFKNHRRLITAAACPRFSHVGDSMPYGYVEIICEALKMTGGKHYHYGPISLDKLKYIQNFIMENGLQSDAFVQLDWTDDVTEDCLRRHVDLFVVSFPVANYATSIRMCAAGIPLIAFDGLQRMSKSDFVYDDCLLWRHAEEFPALCYKLSRKSLRIHSQKALEHYQKNHDIAVLAPYYREVKPFAELKDIYIVDDHLVEVAEHLLLFSGLGDIKFMAQEEEKQKIEKMQDAWRERIEISVGQKQLKREKDDIARYYIDDLKRSTSYRVGSALIWIPKKIRMTLKKIHYRNAAGAVLTKKEYDKYAYDYIPVERLRKLKSEKAFRVGMFVTKPLRKVYRAIKK